MGRSKEWKSLLAKLFPKPPKPLFIRRPRLSPPHEPSFRAPPYPQLRFTPRGTGDIEQGVARRLSTARHLLKNGMNEAALTYCIQELTNPNPDYRLHDFSHRAVSLFTRYRDLEAATALCNHLAEEGYIISKRTYLLLMKCALSRSAQYAHEILDKLLHGGVHFDEQSFKSILDMMLFHRHPAEELEVALKVYWASRPKDWMPPSSIVGAIIQSYSLAGRHDNAEQWLDNYRATRPNLENEVATRSDTDTTEHIAPKQSRAHGQHPVWRVRSGILLSTENQLYPYAAVLIGYIKSPEPSTAGISRLLARMKADNLVPDLYMYNSIIPALVRWGLTRRAFNIFHLLLSPGAPSLPDAYTFRHLYIALNPRRRRGIYGQYPPDDISARALFHSMIGVVRRPLHQRSAQPHKNIISTGTFNAALGTYCAQGDYAAAWTVLALFPRYHIVPDMKTSRIVVLSLIRRMRREVDEVELGEVVWTDRLTGQRRSTMLETTHKMLMADRLFMLGHAAVAEMKERRYQSYLKPSAAISASATKELEFLVGLMRTALQASLGFPRNTSQLGPAERAVSAAMYDARSDMIPRGRSDRN